MSLFSVITLGCPKNQVDSESLISIFEKEGLSNTDSLDDTDFVLINTCGFIQEAKEESIEEILNVVNRIKDGTRLIVFGCLSQRYKDELSREIPEIDAIWGVGQESEIIEYCKKINRGQKSEVTLRKDFDELSRIVQDDNCNGEPVDPQNTENGRQKNRELQPATSNKEQATNNYSYIKIAEGCNRRCTYCVIPLIRGRQKSKSPEIIIKEAENALRDGKKELILIAQDLTSYGKEIGYSLNNLIRDIASINGDFWIRLLYLYPTSIDNNLLETIRSEDKVCNYLDIPIQHSEDRTLKRMGRTGSRKYYLDLIDRVRKQIPDITLRTTIIVGFPGETDHEFKGLISFINEVKFERLGVFEYSDENGTPSFNMKSKLSKKVKMERFNKIMRLQSEISYEKNKEYKGKRFRAIIDSMDNGLIVARLYSHAPEIDGDVIIDGTTDAKKFTNLNNFVNVEIVDTNEYDLVGRLVE